MPFTSCASSLPPQAPAGAPGSLLPGCSDLAAPGLPADSSPQLETLGLRTRGRAPEGRPGPAQIQEIPPRSFASSGSNSRSAATRRTPCASPPCSTACPSLRTPVPRGTPPAGWQTRAPSSTEPPASASAPARRTHAFPTWMRGTTSLLCALGRL